MTEHDLPLAFALALRLTEAGLIQFGRFAHVDGSVWPVQVRLHWLPSYPALLQEVVAALATLLDGLAVDRLLTTPTAVPLGTALSLHSGLPMTYTVLTTHDQGATFAIEGAYDVGHPTLLLTDVLADAAQAQQLSVLARRVGLEVKAVLAAFDLGIGARERLETTGYPVLCLMALPNLLDLFTTQGIMPGPLRATIQRWQATRPLLAQNGV
ncbi:MAG: hypothetical protein ACUVSU_05135 [Aggregatilineaceae bacterium]